MDDEALRAELAALKAEYRASLRPRLARIEAMAAGRMTAQSLEALRQELHSLAGSGGTFALPAVSEAARAAERYLEAHCNAQAAPGDKEWAVLRQHLRSLAQLI